MTADYYNVNQIVITITVAIPGIFSLPEQINTVLGYWYIVMNLQDDKFCVSMTRKHLKEFIVSGRSNLYNSVPEQPAEDLLILSFYRKSSLSATLMTSY